MNKMTPALYEEKRNELMALIESIVRDAKDMPDYSRKELEGTVTRLRRNSFEIAFVGEFQGGKSTTFDTICDGREISPRGIGIKTSACKISAHPVALNEPEVAHLAWKSDADLVKTMLDFIIRSTDDPAEQRLFMQTDRLGKTVLPPLSDGKVMAIARKTIHAEWERFRRRPGAYDPDQAGLLDLLKISTIILDHYDSTEMRKMRGKTLVTLDELKTLVTFPNEWDERWEDGENTKFASSEVAFAFLGAVSCDIHCANLERLGCTITDCPGLFAGPWDTEVAFDAMAHADAILYLIGGAKQMTAGDKRAIGKIIGANYGHKLFFAINARETPDKILRYQSADASIIRQIGFDLGDDTNISIFNAFLAFNAKAMENGCQGDGRSSVAKQVENHLGLDHFKEDDDKLIRTFLEDTGALYKASSMPELLAKIELDVVSKKFKSILDTNGSALAAKALSALNGDLKNQEELAAKSLEDAKKEVEKARTALKSFRDFTEKKVRSAFFNDTIDKILSEDCFDKVFVRSAPALSHAVSESISLALMNDTGGILTMLLKSVAAKGRALFTGDEPDPVELPESVKEKLRYAIEQQLRQSLEGWVSTISNGEDELFKATYFNAIKLVELQVREKWNESYSGNKAWLEGLEIDSETAIPEITDFTGYVEEGGDAFSPSDAANAILPQLAALIAGGVVALLAGMAVWFAAILILPVSWPAWLTMVIAILAGTAGKEVVVEFYEKHIGPRLTDKLEVKVLDSVEAFFKEHKADFLKLTREKIISQFSQNLYDRVKASLEDQKKAFEDRAAKALALKNEEDKEQRRVAIWAKGVREEQIGPAMKRLEAFKKTLVPYFAGAIAASPTGK